MEYTRDRVFVLLLGLVRRLNHSREILKKKKEDKTGTLEQGTITLRLKSHVEDIVEMNT